MPGHHENQLRKARTLAKLLWTAGVRVHDIEEINPSYELLDLMGRAAQQALGTKSARKPSEDTWVDTLQELRHLEDVERWVTR